METLWKNCYEDSWKDFIVPEAFSHPAKMAYGLLSRLLTHAQEQGWLTPQSIILDPFGGISTTGILAAYRGYQAITCELERKFVDLAKQNMELHRNAWVQFGNPEPVILQGDSRRLCELVESADLVVSSPPFMEQQTGGGIAAAMQGKSNYNISDNLKGSNQGYQNQGQTPGQLGSMKPGKIDLVISSPPYASGNHQGCNDETSLKPPHDSTNNTCKGYGSTPGNLGNLKAGEVDCVISSPPYEGSDSRKPSNSVKHRWKGRRELESLENMYNGNENNLGNDKGDTFWSAAKEIVQQCHQILRPGGHAIWVVKNFVRNKRLVDFEGDWEKLCNSVGFITVCKHKAMLTKIEKKPCLFGGDIVKTTKRASFFRRLAESKGSPPIDWERVICMQKPLFPV